MVNTIRWQGRSSDDQSSPIHATVEDKPICGAVVPDNVFMYEMKSKTSEDDVTCEECKVKLGIKS